MSPIAPRSEPDELSRVERGRTLAALRLLGPIAAAARLRSAAARRHLEHLCDPRARAAEERHLGATVPEGLGEIDPSWYSAPPPTRSAAARRYLERICFGRLVPMTAPTGADSARPQPRAQLALDELLLGPLDRLEAALLLLGRRRVAIAFTGAPRSALAQLLARLGEPEAARLVSELRAIPPGISAEEVKAAQRALFRSGEQLGGESAGLFLRRVGCSWIAPLVERADPARARGATDRARRLAQRLPRSLGQLILGEAAQPLAEPERAALLRLIGGLLPVA
jgi:hypothetical protein